MIRRIILLFPSQSGLSQLRDLDGTRLRLVDLVSPLLGNIPSAHGLPTAWILTALQGVRRSEMVSPSQRLGASFDEFTSFQTLRRALRLNAVPFNRTKAPLVLPLAYGTSWFFIVGTQRTRRNLANLNRTRAPESCQTWYERTIHLCAFLYSINADCSFFKRFTPTPQSLRSAAAAASIIGQNLIYLLSPVIGLSSHSDSNISVHRRVGTVAPGRWELLGKGTPAMPT